MDIKFDFNDILIEPAVVSYISHRREINILDENGMLPIFTAPMFDVVNEENSDIYNSNGIYSIIPRKSEYKKEELITNNPKKFVALGLDDFIHMVIENDLELSEDKKAYILIDIANGHMVKLVKAIGKAKHKYGQNIIIMCGNIANPRTFTILSDAGADYIRLGIGNGSACLTTEQSSIGYPMASLIADTYKESLSARKPAKIIADGGIKSYSDAIKALALGANGIMLGGLLNKCLESSGDLYELNGSEYAKITKEKAQMLLSNKEDVFKQYKGMSTKEVQRILGNDRLKTSEGIVKYNKVEYTLSGWVENFNDYLKSNMSYCGKENLEEFVGKVEYIHITYNSYLRYHK